MKVRNIGLNRGIIFFVMFRRVRDVIGRLRRCCWVGMMEILRVIIVEITFWV
jgi:hypothetical protein